MYSFLSFQRFARSVVCRKLQLFQRSICYRKGSPTVPSRHEMQVKGCASHSYQILNFDDFAPLNFRKI